MPAGLQIFNADGSLQFDTTKRAIRLVGVVQTGLANGFATVPTLSSGTPIAVVTPLAIDDGASPVVTIVGTDVSWDWGSEPSPQNNSITLMVY